MVVNERLRASIDVAPSTAAFYDHVISALEEERLPFMLGGAFAFEVYTDIGGQTKDLDLFLHPRDVDAAMAALAKRGYETEMKARHWLGKVKSERDFVDIIFSSGNGLAPAAVGARVCVRTGPSRAPYLRDVEGWGYRGGRLSPYGGLTESDVEHETARMRKELGR